MPSCRHSRDLFDGGHDVGVGCAPADIAAHSLANFYIGEFGGWLRQIVGNIARHALPALGQHSDRRTDLARGAIPALKAVMFNERGLQWMQIIAFSESLDRSNGLAIMHNREGQAGVDAASFNQYRACSALAMIATLL